jgi:hypothetical protein
MYTHQLHIYISDKILNKMGSGWNPVEMGEETHAIRGQKLTGTVCNCGNKPYRGRNSNRSAYSVVSIRDCVVIQQKRD